MNESIFLHNHPRKEKELGLDKNHVIIDREDWEQAKQIIKTNKRIGIISGGFSDIYCGIDHDRTRDHARTIVISHEDIVSYPHLPTIPDLPFDREGLSLELTILQGTYNPMKITMQQAAESFEKLATAFQGYELNNQKKRKGHERPYKFHR